MDKAALIAEMEATLPGFTGTESYTRIRYPWCSSFLLTDGAKYVAETAKAYWLMDAISSYQPKLVREHFQTWKLTVANGKAVLTATDGNDRKLATQEIDSTDFPLPEITLFVERSESLGGLVVFLPSEY
jgi:hypothetical protein